MLAWHAHLAGEKLFDGSSFNLDFHSVPILLASDPFKNTVAVPWWNGTRLQLSTYVGTPER